ncbi:MAG: PD40 domain-containing protein [Candidatus Latescibacteria bacterium]|nr:PD40 domain-containing protein [Candidatus Latescibacterota bacterium]
MKQNDERGTATFLVAFILLWASAAQAQQEVVLGARANILQRLDIAVQPFVPDSPSMRSAVGDTISRVLIRDLKLSGVFNVIDLSVTVRDTTGQVLLAFVDSKGRVDFDVLRKTPARLLVSGRYQVRNPQIEMTLDLTDVQSRRVSTSKGYAAFDITLRRVVHRMADDVVRQLTGEEGIAQTRIAFVSDRTGQTELYLADYDGFNVRRLTNDRSILLFPRWSPDGSRIAYTSYRDGNRALYVANVQTGETKKVSTGGHPVISPAWSPDGRRLTFGLTIEGSTQLYLCNADGSELRPLTSMFGDQLAPSWSPQGNQLAFTSSRTGLPQVYVMDADGLNERRLTFDGNYNDSSAWSPKGDRIAFVSRDPGGFFNIYTIDVNGDNLLKLTDNMGSNENPSWSPDGLHLLFSSNRTGRYEIYTMNWDGTGVYRVTLGGGDNITPSWGPRPGGK